MILIGETDEDNGDSDDDIFTSAIDGVGVCCVAAVASRSRSRIESSNGKVDDDEIDERLLFEFEVDFPIYITFNLSDTIYFIIVWYEKNLLFDLFLELLTSCVNSFSSAVSSFSDSDKDSDSTMTNIWF